MKQDRTNMTICSRCHKWQNNEGYLRKNYKNTGEKRYFSICNWCNDRKKIPELTKKVQELDIEFKKKINFMLPYNI